LDEWKRNRPAVIIVAAQESSFFRDEGTPPLLTEKLGELLKTSYRLVGYVMAGDQEVRHFTGPVVQDDLPRPEIHHTLAVWERTGR
ncbi:MAG TPA: hypothetical protein VH120_07795, partial [Gemmataceae bacterium]|nr:hypothetical protein [Gemmataceae bacterium]